MFAGAAHVSPAAPDRVCEGIANSGMCVAGRAGLHFVLGSAASLCPSRCDCRELGLQEPCSSPPLECQPFPPRRGDDPGVGRQCFVCPPCQVTAGSSSPFLSGVFVGHSTPVEARRSMGSVPGAGWAVCAALGSTWLGSDFKTDAVITCFVFPPLSVLSQTERGSLHGDTWVVTVQPDSLCSRMALYRVIEVSRVALFSLPGTLGRFGSVLLFT